MSSLPASFFQVNNLWQSPCIVSQTVSTTGAVYSTGANTNITTYGYNEDYTGASFPFYNPFISSNTTVSATLLSSMSGFVNTTLGNYPSNPILTTSGQAPAVIWLTLTPGNTGPLNSPYLINTVVY